MAKLGNFGSHAFLMILRTSFLFFVFPVSEDLKPVIPERAHQKQESETSPEENIAGLVHKAEGEIHGPNGGGDFYEKQRGGDESFHAVALG